MKKYILTFLTLGLLACSRETFREDISMPATPVLTATSRWGVVSDSYIRITHKDDRHNLIIATLRKGDIVEILSRETEKESDSGVYWFEVKTGEIHGVVPEGSIELYDSREKALNASDQM